MAKKKDIIDVTLEIELPVDEMADIAKFQAEKELELIEVEREKRETSTEIRTRIKQIRQELAIAATEISTGKGERNVKAKRVKTGSSMQFWSPDGKTLYSERTLSPDEMQEDLALAD